MPIDLYGGVFKKASNWACGSPLLNNILGSSIFVAITISLLMVVLIMVMYPAKAGTPFSIIIKMFIYMLFGSLLIVFLHDGVIKYMNDEKLEDAASNRFMQNTTMEGRKYDPAYGSTYKTINPDQPDQPIVTSTSVPPVQTSAPAQPNTPSQSVQGGTVSEFYNIVEGGRLYAPKPPTARPNPFATR